MHRIASLLVAGVGLVSLSCHATVSPQAGGAGYVATPGPAPSGAGAPAGGYAPGEDTHWIQADDFFVGNQAYTSNWINVYVAKMKQAPSAATKGAGLFFTIRDAAEEWSPHFYRTRPAMPADVIMGNLLICFNDNKFDEVYQAPKDRDSARQGTWWVARITDTADLHKGYVTMVGYHCATGALRAPLQ